MVINHVSKSWDDPPSTIFPLRTLLPSEERHTAIPGGSDLWRQLEAEGRILYWKNIQKPISMASPQDFLVNHQDDISSNFW